MVPKKSLKDLLKFVEEFNKTIKNELATNEPDLKVSTEKIKKPKTVMDGKTQSRLLNALYAVPHGVIAMSPDIPGLVETSTNLATISTEGKYVNIVTSQRSSVASENQDVTNMVSSVFNLAEAEVNFGDGYPGWKPNINSQILKILKNVYHDIYGVEPEIKAIHAGLECGIIGEKYSQMDMISFGPTMHGVHSPDERLKIDSVLPFYELLVNVLRNIPER
jgi:dipeptidase D